MYRFTKAKVKCTVHEKTTQMGNNSSIVFERRPTLIESYAFNALKGARFPFRGSMDASTLRRGIIAQMQTKTDEELKQELNRVMDQKLPELALLGTYLVRYIITKSTNEEAYA